MIRHGEASRVDDHLVADEGSEPDEERQCRDREAGIQAILVHADVALDRSLMNHEQVVEHEVGRQEAVAKVEAPALLNERSMTDNGARLPGFGRVFANFQGDGGGSGAFPLAKKA